LFVPKSGLCAAFVAQSRLFWHKRNHFVPA